MLVPLRRLTSPTPAIVLACSISIGATFAAQSGSTAAERAARGLELARAGNLTAAESELRAAVALAPNEPAYLGDLGTVLAMENKLAESTTYLSRAVKLDPDALVVRQNLAANLWHQHRFREAKENLQIILRSQPHNQEVILLLGMVSENAGDYAAAARWLGSVPELVRQRPESVAALARSYYRLNDQAKARQTLHVLLHNPSNPDGIFLGGSVAAQAGDDSTAERFFTAIPGTYPERSKVEFNLALVQYHAGRYAEAQSRLQNLIQEGNETSEVDNLLGWCYEKQGNSAKSIDLLERAVDRDPKQESNYLDLGKILASRKLYPAALAISRRAVQNLPESAALFDLKGSVELTMNQYTDAIASYSRARELSPGSSGATLGLALAEDGAGMTQQATRTFDRGIREFPRDARFELQYALMLLGLADAGNTAARPHAEALLKRAVLLDGSFAEAHYQLGNLALEKGDTAAALSELEAAKRIEPDSSKVHFALARAYRRFGKRDLARREMTLYETLKRQEEQSARFVSPAGMAHE